LHTSSRRQIFLLSNETFGRIAPHKINAKATGRTGAAPDCS